jgi:hypothetical protein
MERATSAAGVAMLVLPSPLEIFIQGANTLK